MPKIAKACLSVFVPPSGCYGFSSEVTLQIIFKELFSEFDCTLKKIHKIHEFRLGENVDSRIFGSKNHSKNQMKL